MPPYVISDVHCLNSVSSLSYRNKLMSDKWQQCTALDLVGFSVFERLRQLTLTLLVRIFLSCRHATSLITVG